MDITKRVKRHNKIRSRISGTEERPRLLVSRSNKHISATLINDREGKTLISTKDIDLKGTKTERAEKVGDAIAKEAKAKKIDKVVFDRGGYKYHGRVKALAEAARKSGLKF
ncbi:MAG: 50S ribosomal protein L18 [Candidatus Pacebacteria bacterium]|nr:50S ribosomal protein L18 [Candidatus Paceibacterota bacterium]MDD3919076.1 50S ribosomal protein L18 [Candidatus Paceibacterota bacterium]